jgi:hypothetical protein
VVQRGAVMPAVEVVLPGWAAGLALVIFLGGWLVDRGISVRDRKAKDKIHEQNVNVLRDQIALLERQLEEEKQYRSHLVVGVHRQEAADAREALEIATRKYDAVLEEKELLIEASVADRAQLQQRLEAAAAELAERRQTATDADAAVAAAKEARNALISLVKRTTPEYFPAHQRTSPPALVIQELGDNNSLGDTVEVTVLAGTLPSANLEQVEVLANGVVVASQHFSPRLSGATRITLPVNTSFRLADDTALFRAGFNQLVARAINTSGEVIAEAGAILALGTDRSR